MAKLAGGITLLGSLNSVGSTGGWPYCFEMPEFVRFLRVVVSGAEYEAHLAPGQSTHWLQELLTPLIIPGFFGPRARQETATIEQWERYNNMRDDKWYVPVTALASPQGDESWVVPIPVDGMAKAIKILRTLGFMKIGTTNAIIAHAMFAITTKVKRAVLECVDDDPVKVITVDEPRELSIKRKTIKSKVPDSAKVCGLSSPFLFMGRLTRQLQEKTDCRDGPLNRVQMAFEVLGFSSAIRNFREPGMYAPEEEADTTPELYKNDELHYNIRGFLTDVTTCHTDYVKAIWQNPTILAPVVEFWKEFEENAPVEEDIREGFRANFSYVVSEEDKERVEAAQLSAEFVSKQHMERCINKSRTYGWAKKHPYLYDDEPWQCLEAQYVRLIADIIQLSFFNLMWALCMVDGVNATLNPAYKMMAVTGLLADVLAVRDDYDDEETLTSEEFNAQVKLAPAFVPSPPRSLITQANTDIRESGTRFMIERVDLLGLVTMGFRVFKGRAYVDAYLAGAKGLSSYNPPGKDDPDPDNDAECIRITAARNFCATYNTTGWREAAKATAVMEPLEKWTYGITIPKDETTLYDVPEYDDALFKEVALAAGKSRAYQLALDMKEVEKKEIFMRKCDAPGSVCQPLAWRQFLDNGAADVVWIELGRDHRREAEQYFVKIDVGTPYKDIRDHMEGTTPDRATSSGIDLGGDVSDDETRSARSDEEA
jgi:hypothetical protein